MKQLRVLLLPILLVTWAAVANGQAIVYTEEGVGQGTLNGTPFNADVTFTFVGDESNVTNPSIFFNSPGDTSVTVDGFGTATVLNATQMFSTATGVVGIQNANNDTDILDIASPPLAGYDLTTAVGPATGSSFGTDDDALATSLGTFEFTTLPTSATFTATTGDATTPEPGIVVTFAGMTISGGLFGLRRRYARNK